MAYMQKLRHIIVLLAVVVAVSTLSSSSQVYALEGKTTIDFTYNGRQYRYIDDKITASDHLVAQEIEERKINAPLEEKIKLVDKCINMGADYKSAILYCFPLLENKVTEIVGIVEKEAVDSSIKFNPAKKPMFKITKEKMGYVINESDFYKDIYIHLKQGGKGDMVVRPTLVKPQINSYDNIKLTNLRSSYSTSYINSVQGRCENIELALKKINGYVLYSGQEFSFNKVVGRRSEENGFKEAKIIVDGEYTEGFGGGVCQVSTTLYNAVLLSDLCVSEVRGHSLECSYVPNSFDAMVSAYSSDLKFKNTQDTPIFIRAYSKDKTANIEIYGASLPYKISTKTVIVSKDELPQDKEIIDVEHKYFDQNAVAGERIRVSYPHASLKSEGYLCYYDKNGNVIETKLIRRDSYKSSSGVVAIAPTQEEIDDYNASKVKQSTEKD